MKASISRLASMFKAYAPMGQQNRPVALAFALAAAFLFSAVPIEAMAQSMSMPFIEGVGCQVAMWMKGPLAILIFIVVCIATLVIGLITKMDWGRMISVAIVFGIIQGLVSILLSTGTIQLPSCLS
ncbi:hypothetical protein [Polaromonas sp.]|uniref:hypothetical protein n=1 Tax=Polaromonas sp. TaxID=1869339 RepID=UPI002731DE1F|nr:hypothetical protein [Polaromonas sp.]MDP2449593.1 hypothetical protein [Polaromonas sp.]